MRFSTILTGLTLGASSALASAIPALSERQTAVCTGSEPSAVCCATDVLGLADLNCATPPTAPTSVDDFRSICAAIGQQARCCLLPVLEQALVCSAPI
ncbi:hypothetical protein H2203_007511 [Taxawa tesnikishii (nom. ined.)]|nr:hypothetical protein H2203_007511 [Dothideales sp. JES 119]